MATLTKRITALGTNPLLWILLLALGIRLYACMTTYIVNPDGIHYIYQARAIYFHEWDSLTACQIKYISPLPFFIAAVFGIFQDWLVAGRFVTSMFSFAALIPLYFVIRRFLDRPLTHVTLLIFALIPVLVGRSADIIRGPIFWFFLALGLLMFVRHEDDDSGRRYRIDLPLSCIFFLLAAWARIEGILFIGVSTLYLLWRGNRRLEKCLWFLTPLMVVGVGALIGSWIVDLSHTNFLRLDKIQKEPLQLIANYQSVRSHLKILSQDHGPMHEFLKQVRDVVWIVPFGPLINCLLEYFFYPYVLIYIWGFCGIRRRVQQDRRVVYFLLLSIAAIVLLYIHLLHTWLIYDRFLATLIFPAAIILGFGCDNIIRYLQRRFNLKKRTAWVLLIGFILIFGLGKNLRPRYEEKMVYRQIAEMITQRKNPAELARIATVPSNAYEWVFFYANKEYPGTPCAKSLIGQIGTNYREFVDYLKADDIRYVLWTEAMWPRDQLDLLASPYAQDFTVLGKWRYQDSDRLMLLERKQE